jgi:C-terminal processing protease CtpA/Prc
LGAVAVDSVAAGLSQDKGGAMSDSNYDANVGSGLLKGFVVTFDYAHQLMYLKRVTPRPADAGSFDRSGLWINAKSGGYVVADIATGSAAAVAGMQVGDVITAIDGQPARAAPAGTTVQLSLRRGAQVRSVGITLKDQI